MPVKCFCSLKVLLISVVFEVAVCFTKFHEGLETADLKHYFGTNKHDEVPDYEFVRVKDMESKEPESQQYHVAALGDNYHMILYPNVHLVSPDCVIVNKYDNGTENRHSCDSLGVCHYHGYLNGRNSSSVAVSTCDGLRGVLSEGDHDLYIQPVKSHHLHLAAPHLISTDTSGPSRTPHSDTSQHSDAPHLIYRRQAKEQFCAHTGEHNTDVFHERTDDIHRRERRSIREHLELKIVVAPDAQKYHGVDTERFITTVMNMNKICNKRRTICTHWNSNNLPVKGVTESNITVAWKERQETPDFRQAAKLFLDSSLGHQIKLSIVEMTILRTEQRDLRIDADSGLLLHNFCQWQKNHESNTAKVSDGTLFITKTDLIHNGDQSNVGLANMASVCTINKCSVNEDTGLDTALTIAHETGHTLGMQHDGTGNGCKDGVNIMAAGGSYGPTASKWSSCSASYLNKFLSSSKSSCMDNVPDGSAVQLYRMQQNAGILYSADQQCTMLYGNETEACHSTENPCGSYCLEPKKGNAVRLCMDFGTYRADGTECATGKWCLSGRCVSYGNSGPRSVHGGWGPFDKEWSSCSRTCGGGVKVKSRKCNNPSPRFGGRNCVGEESLAKICNVQPCGTSEFQFKDQQCSATNDKNHYKSYDIRGNDQCQLKCLRTENGMIYDRGQTFTDGTECSIDSPFTSKCVQGKCKAFGCDGHLGSQIRFDNCGECGGTGRACNVHSGTYNQGRANAFVTFLTIPRGSTAVTVTNGNVYCYMSVVVSGRRLFSHQGASPSGTYNGNGIEVQYRKSGPEKIHIIGPTARDLQVQVYREYDDTYMGVKPEIRYTYYIPTRVQNPAPYHWQTRTSACSKTCGTGKLSVSAICVQRSTNKEVADAKCNLFQKPREDVRDCNTRTCPPEWHAFEWGGCSRSCGGGTMTRRVACVTIQRDQYTAVADNRCNLARKPSGSQRCATQNCAGVWRASAWSACSQTCAYGVRTRSVRCYVSRNSNQPIKDAQCDQAQKPTTTEKCMTRPCDMKTGGASCHDKKSDCSAYGYSSCRGQYSKWAQENCASYCGFCVQNPSAYQSSVDPNCRDTVKCADYGADVCTAYAGWSSTHCKKHCNLCGAGVSSGSGSSSSSSSSSQTSHSSTNGCKDKVNCKEYGDNVCSEYASWSKENCQVTCNLCKDTSSNQGSSSSDQSSASSSQTSNQCIDKVACDEYGDDVCVKFSDWSKKNCAKTCKLCGGGSPSSADTVSSTVVSSDPCKDKVKCEEYGANVCKDYSDWSHKNCARHCKFCQPCTDARTDCAEYGQSACTGAYLSWAKKNCKKYCNVCGDRRKRDVAYPIVPPPKMSKILESNDVKNNISPVNLKSIHKIEETLTNKSDEEIELKKLEVKQILGAKEEDMVLHDGRGMAEQSNDTLEIPSDETDESVGLEGRRGSLIPEIESGRVPVPVPSKNEFVNAIEIDTPPPPPPKRLPGMLVGAAESGLSSKSNDLIPKQREESSDVDQDTLHLEREIDRLKDIEIK